MRLLFSVLLLISCTVSALAQSSPNLRFNQIPTSAQWNSYFAGKQDVLNYTPVNRNGDTMAGRLVTAAPGSATSGLGLTCGGTPSSPADGDMWCTGGSLYARLSGATVLLSAPPARYMISKTVNFNAVGDTTFTMALPPGFTHFLIESVRVYAASQSLTTATVGVFTGTGGTGVAVVTGGSAMTVNSGTDATNNNAQALTVNNATTESYTLTAVPSLYFRVGVAEGAAATATVSITLIPLL